MSAAHKIAVSISACQSAMLLVVKLLGSYLEEVDESAGSLGQASVSLFALQLE